ncbi:Ant1p [Sugiyamaella lignohabitans]|uniref:Ant1p n=1 Tax=Sugiyamaella lignohabitans TaxID=796027 RepID=A0A170QXH9_9ASCO|nr:Ant1p [Sugiyamaella lignohabitans]ANB15942.1 Ant1p [Sugiyamaella lignohabitans]
MPEKSVKKRIQPSDIPPLANAFSGAVGGAVANLAVFPLDLVTTRFQVQTKLDTAEKYDGLVDAFIKIYKADGIAGFYDGAVSDTVATTAQAFFYFFAYDALRSKRLSQHARKLGGVAPSTLGVGEELAIGSLAGIFAKFFISPLNNIVARQQTSALVKKELDESNASEKPSNAIKQSHHDSAIEIVKAIYKERGFLGFWSGYKATVLLSINPSLTYYFFQLFTAVLIPKRRRKNPTSVEIFFLAAWAKTIATLITYPIILAKTRIQIVRATKSAGSLFSQILKTLDSEGIQGLYMGARSQILKGFFSQGITMMTKDQIARLIIYVYFVGKKYIV